MADIKVGSEYASPGVDNIFMSLLVDHFKARLKDALEEVAKTQISELVEKAAKDIDVRVLSDFSYAEQSRTMQFTLKLYQEDLERRMFRRSA